MWTIKKKWGRENGLLFMQSAWTSFLLFIRIAARMVTTIVPPAVADMSGAWRPVFCVTYRTSYQATIDQITAK